MPPLDLYARVRVFMRKIAHETAGAACTRLSLRPLFQVEGGSYAKLGRISAARTRTHTLPRRGPIASEPVPLELRHLR